MTFSKLCDKYPHYIFGSYGIRCFFLYNERQFRAFARDAQLKGRYAEWVPTLAGRCIYCETHEGDGPWILAVILNGDRLKSRGVTQFVNTAVHECCHAFDDVMNHINEERPGNEVRAYGVDGLVAACLDSAPASLRLAWYDATHGVEQRKRGLKIQSRRTGRKVK